MRAVTFSLSKERFEEREPRNLPQGDTVETPVQFRTVGWKQGDFRKINHLCFYNHAVYEDPHRRGVVDDTYDLEASVRPFAAGIVEDRMLVVYAWCWPVSHPYGVWNASNIYNASLNVHVYERKPTNEDVVVRALPCYGMSGEVMTRGKL